MPAPNAPAWKLATVPTPPWEPNAARNSRDLYAAFEQARKLDRPDAWLVAADIAGACYANAISPAQRNRLAEERGAWNSTQAGQSDRDAKLANLQKREAALAELEQRCKGFRGTDSESIAVIEELREKAKRSDTDLGRLLRTNAALREGEVKASEWEPAMNAALASGNPVLIRMALYGMAQELFEEPKLSGFGALLTAAERVNGPEFDRNDLETLAICVIGGPCERTDPSTMTPPADWNQARWDDLVQQYEEALRARDVRRVLEARPS